MDVIFGNPVVSTIVLIVAALLVVTIAILSTWKKVPNDHAAVIVGVGKPRVVTGGGTIVIPLLQRMDMISLETLPITPTVSAVKTSLGVPINAEGYAIIKVKDDESQILTAMQMFYCNNEEKTKQKIIEQAQELCKGKLREIISSMTVEEIYDDREKFSKTVLEVASSALDGIGLELKSFTINDITDDDEYIESLGKKQIAEVKASAAIAEAEAAKEREIKTAEAARERDIKTAEANRAGKQAQLAAETQIAESEKEKQLKLLQYQKEQQSSKAETDAAYQIQQNITLKKVTDTEMDAQILREQRNREVREAEIQVQIAAEQKNIELAKKQAERKEAELLATVVKPAEADKQRAEITAEAQKVAQVKKAEAEAESKKLDAEAQAEVIKQQGLAQATVIKEQGTAEADAIKLKGLAEAEALDKKAEALAKMDEAGKLQMVMDKLPEIAKAVAEPMSRIGNITIIGGGSGGNGAADVAANTVGAMKAVFEAMKETTGFDMTDVLKANTLSAKTDRNLKIDVTGVPEEYQTKALAELSKRVKDDEAIIEEADMGLDDILK